MRGTLGSSILYVIKVFIAINMCLSTFPYVGYPHIVASVVVSSVTGAEIKNLRDKILCAVSELENSCRCFHICHCYISRYISYVCMCTYVYKQYSVSFLVLKCDFV